jgi:hypothetical protein
MHTLTIYCKTCTQVDVLSGLQQPDAALLQRAALSMPRTDMAVAVTNRGSYFTGGCGIPADPLGRPLLVSVSTCTLQLLNHKR